MDFPTMKLEQIYELLKRAERKVQVLRNCRATPLNLKTLVHFGRTAPASKSFGFLRNELPIRIANTLHEVSLLPPSLLMTRSVYAIAKQYDESFDKLMSYQRCDPSRPSVISEFTDDLLTILERHADFVTIMAMGIKEMRENGNFSLEEELRLHYFLDRFYVSRIGIRTLINQHTLLYGTNLCENESHVGCIDPDCSPLRVAISAYAYARLLCTRTYGRAPGCNMETLDRVSQKMTASHGAEPANLCVTVDPDGQPSEAHELFEFQPSCADLHIQGRNLTLCYIPGHLFHMLFELFKNAMRAVVEHYPGDSELPRLRLLFCHGPEDVTIRLSDDGGGMARHIAAQAFNYTFTTALHSTTQSTSDCQTNEKWNHIKDVSRHDPEGVAYSLLAGRGHGLPLSRLYACYLSGDLRLVSVEGHGTSVFIHLKRLPEDACELLPLVNYSSRATYPVLTDCDDWISGGGVSSEESSTTISRCNNVTIL